MVTIPGGRMRAPRLFASVTCGLSYCLTLTACPLHEPPDFSARAALGPIAIGDHLVVGDDDADALVVLDVDDGHLVASRRIALDGAPSLVVPTPDARAALVLSKAARTLDVVSTADGDRRTLDLGAPFEGLALAPDGRAAIAYYPPGTASAVFHNENEIALVDLTPSARTPVTRRTLASLGGAPRAIAMSPLAGARRYAFVLSDEHVAVLALDAPAMPERSVPLVSLTTGGSRTPSGVVFAVDPATTTLWAIVSTLEASSVYALAIAPAPPSAADAPDFDVRLSQLTGISPGGAASLVALTTDDGPALYTLTTNPATGHLTLTDVATATGRAIGVRVGLDRLHLFEDEAGAPFALAWSSHEGRTFHVVDLERLAAGDSRAFETRTASAPFTTLMPLPSPDDTTTTATSRFLALHTSADEGVSVIDAATSRVTGFGRTGAIRQLELAPDLGRLYLLTTLPEGDFVVSVDLASLHPEAALVPDGADALALLPGASTVAAIAHRDGGLVTLWPADATRDDHTRVVPGFLLADLFQR